MEQQETPTLQQFQNIQITNLVVAAKKAIEKGGVYSYEEVVQVTGAIEFFTKPNIQQQYKQQFQPQVEQAQQTVRVVELPKKEEQKEEAKV